MVLRLALTGAVLLLTTVKGLPTCTSDRPGKESHRTLYVSDSKLQGGAKDDMWTNVLCCVYTHVEVTSTTSSSGTMKLYDNSHINVKADDFETMAELALELICDMYMGSRDCDNQSACIDNALAATASPTIPPTIPPTISPTTSPTVSTTITALLPSEEPTVTPTASPTISMTTVVSLPPSTQPVEAPGTAAPTVGTLSDCEDSPYRFKVLKDGEYIWRNCFWVMNRATKSRCKLEGVKTICPKTCEACSTCIDASSRIKFEKSDGRRITRDCQWTANRDTVNRCKLQGMAITCKKTCGQCP